MLLAGLTTIKALSLSCLVDARTNGHLDILAPAQACAWNAYACIGRSLAWAGQMKGTVNTSDCHLADFLLMPSWPGIAVRRPRLSLKSLLQKQSLPFQNEINNNPILMGSIEQELDVVLSPGQVTDYLVQTEAYDALRSSSLEQLRHSVSWLT